MQFLLEIHIMTFLDVSILTIFPDMFPGTLKYSIAGRALRRNIWSYKVFNIRDFGITKHKRIDDVEYGGGIGMIMRPDVVSSCIDYVLNINGNSTIYYLSSRGIIFNQDIAFDIIHKKKIIILCGRFKGIDERIIDEYNIQEISIGNYILSGGELAALVILDCLVRLLPGVLIKNELLNYESFNKEGVLKGLLQYPLYTKPLKWRGRCVPNILLSGNHKLIDKWKKESSINITKKFRPNLLNN